MEALLILHIASAFLVLMSLGTLIGLKLGGALQSGWRKWYAALQGIALLGLLITGYYMWKNLQIPWGKWLQMKLFIWVALGAAPVLIRRASYNFSVFNIIWFLGVTAAALGILKIF